MSEMSVDGRFRDVQGRSIGPVTYWPYGEMFLNGLILLPPRLGTFITSCFQILDDQLHLTITLTYHTHNSKDQLRYD